jgi:hypothetical protein
MVLANRFQQNRLYLNNESTIFIDVTEERMPREHNSRSRDVEIGDLDGDGIIDIHITNTEFNPNRVYLNDPLGYFLKTVDYSFKPEYENDNFDAELEDVDNDGDLDICIASLGGIGKKPRVKLLINYGGGIFFEESAQRIFPHLHCRAWDCEIADVNGDTNLDIFIVESGIFSGDFPKTRLLINDGFGYFIDESEDRLPQEPVCNGRCHFGDYDGDGDFDVVIANLPHEVTNQLWENDGTGVFTDVTNKTLPELYGRANEMRFGDIDSDGDLDIVVAMGDSTDHLFINVGIPDSTPPTVHYITRHMATKNAYFPYPVIASIADNTERLENIILHYRINSNPWDFTPMRWIGGHLFRGNIPHQPLGTSITYYITVEDGYGNPSTFPPPSDHYTFHITEDVLFTIAVSENPLSADRGETIIWKVHLKNRWKEDSLLDLWCVMFKKLKNDRYIKVKEDALLLDITMKGKEEIEREVSFEIPVDIETGLYHITTLVGDYNLMPINLDTFHITVTGGLK